MTLIERGQRWAGRIRPGHPAFAAIQAAITGWEPDANSAGAPSTGDIQRASGIPAGTLGKYMRTLREAGWVTARKSGRGFIWAWVGEPVVRAAEMAAEATAAHTGTRHHPSPEPAFLADVDGPILRVQLAPAVDNPGGYHRRPEPFVVYPMGGIGAQDFWRGRPLAAIGFAATTARERIVLWWADYVAAGDWATAAGLYLVTENVDGDWVAQLTPVESVTEVARVRPDPVPQSA